MLFQKEKGVQSEELLLRTNMKNEIWKEVKNTDGRYFISNMGRFKSLYGGKVRITIGSKDKNCYFRVLLNKKTVKVHRLVCEYFLENFDSSLTVNHKDFNKGNNQLDNLESLSNRDNNIHYVVNKKKDTSSSKTLGVGFHKGIKRWTARVLYNGERVSVGSYLTEKEAQDAVLNFNEDGVKKGKGISSIGKRKYSNYFMIRVLTVSKEIGVRKAAKKYGLGTSTISIYRRKHKTNPNTRL